MTTPQIVLVDLTAIPGSFEGWSLFVNDTHILDADESLNYPIAETADNLAQALGVPVQKAVLRAEDLAAYLAAQTDQLDEFNAQRAAGECDVFDWTNGYRAQDVLAAARMYALAATTEPNRQRYLVQGRIPGDDDDTTMIIEASALVQAKRFFQVEMYANSDQDPKEVAERHGEAIFYIAAYALTEAEVYQAP